MSNVSDDHINGEEGYEVPGDLCPGCCRIPCTCLPTKVPDLRGVPLAELAERKPRGFNSSV